jgi:3',5'-cyclic AMP phosphodiesterase CpdA
MLSRRRFIATLALSSLNIPRLLGGIRYSPLPADGITPVRNLQPKKICIIGDIQGTSGAEEMLLARSDNADVRTRIVQAVVDEHPDMLLLLGDQIALGENESDWVLFDQTISPVIQAKIPTYALRGNHDYGLNIRNPRNLRNFYKRFSAQSHEMPDVVTLGPIVLIALDSNFDMLSSSDYKNQIQRYQDALEKLDNDPNVKGVIVASHHPPYTNSSLGADYGVIAQFATPFLKARKTRLYLSGHVHSYERFAVQDKMFVTSGGGGGPRRQVDVSSDRSFKNDAYRSNESLRPFNYVRLQVNDGSLDAEVMMLRKLKGKSEYKFVVGDRFSVGLYLPENASAAPGQ